MCHGQGLSASSNPACMTYTPSRSLLVGESLATRNIILLCPKGLRVLDRSLDTEIKSLP